MGKGYDWIRIVWDGVGRCGTVQNQCGAVWGMWASGAGVPQSTQHKGLSPTFVLQQPPPWPLH